MKDKATVKIHLPHGDPSSLRIAEISNWTGKAVACPRSQLDLALQREEARKPGVYFLAGINPETGKQRVYIGEAEIICDRIKRKDHLDRDFWQTIIFFVSKDENLTKAHIKYLEGRLIEMTKEAGRSEVDNSNSSGSHLPEADAADMDVFLGKMEQLLPVLGQDFLKPMIRPDRISKTPGIMLCKIKGATAKGRTSENGFVVLKGSEAVLNERPSVKKYPYPSILRTQLRDDGVIEERAGKLVFMKDYEFSSPSAAASVIHGGHANGLKEWRDATGMLLRDKERTNVPNNASEATSEPATSAASSAPQG